MNKWLGTCVAVLLAMAGGGWHLSAEVTDTKRRVDTVEKRQQEDRREARENLNEVKEHVKVIDANVQIILQKVSAIEAAQKAERRR